MENLHFDFQRVMISDYNISISEKENTFPKNMYFCQNLKQQQNESTVH